ncbi:MAG TPA: hypothetical protein VGL08_15895 [Paraburkholderia sp.]|jgi:Tfp pilus assembly protein PilO
MSTTILDRLGPARKRTPARIATPRWADRLRVPLDAWSGRRRLLAALLIALAVFGLCANAWFATDLGGAEASRLLIADAQRRLAHTRLAVAQLPTLRASAATTRFARSSGEWTSTDDVRAVTQLAAQTGMTLLTLEPGAVTGSGMDVMRSLRVTAHADFAQLIAFLRALPSLPVLVVPGDMIVKRLNDVSAERPGGVLSINATLNVFNAIRPLEAATDPLADAAVDEDEDVLFYDPFSPPPQTDSHSAAAATLRLVGVLYDLARGLALVETPEGETTLEAGQRFGGERVARVDGSGITLATRNGGARTLTFEEAVQ